MRLQSLSSIALLIFGLALTVAMVGGAAAAQPGKRKADPEAGKDSYDRSCWMCHGKDGSGNGPAALALNVMIPSLRGISESEFPARVDVVQEGRGAMPGFAETMDRPTARRVFIYLASLDDPSANQPAVDGEPDAPDKDAAPDDQN